MSGQAQALAGAAGPRDPLHGAGDPWASPGSKTPKGVRARPARDRSPTPEDEPQNKKGKQVNAANEKLNDKLDNLTDKLEHLMKMTQQHGEVLNRLPDLKKLTDAVEENSRRLTASEKKGDVIQLQLTGLKTQAAQTAKAVGELSAELNAKIKKNDDSAQAKLDELADKISKHTTAAGWTSQASPAGDLSAYTSDPFASQPNIIHVACGELVEAQVMRDYVKSLLQTSKTGLRSDQWDLKAADALTRRGRIIFKGESAALDASKFFGACKESNG